MLTSEQAKKQNQEKYGFNELVEGKKKSIPQIFFRAIQRFPCNHFNFRSSDFRILR